MRIRSYSAPEMTGRVEPEKNRIADYGASLVKASLIPRSFLSFQVLHIKKWQH